MCRPIRKCVSHLASLGFVCLALLIATAPYLSGQEHSVEAGKAPASAQPVERDYRFEVASVRPSDPPTGLEYKSGLPGPSYTPGHYREDKVTFAFLAGQAFRVKHNYELECPRWMESTYFTINATLPEGATKADLPIMIQHMLEDRFGLVFHHETRRLGGYELVVAKSGPKLTKSAGPASDQSAVKSSSAPMPFGPGIEFKNGVPQFTKDAGSGQLYGPTGAIWRGRNKTMKSLVEDLDRKLGVPVMDATGLEGEYDYTLTFTDEAYSGSAQNVVSPLGGTPGPAAGEDGASVPLAHPLLRDALEEQLGLKLQSAKNVPVDVVIIDSANKVPTEN
jgi:uncharacterized protein (TIGR03435 family)